MDGSCDDLEEFSLRPTSVGKKVRLGSTVFVVGAGTFCLFPVSLEDYLK